jgi:hypothetical protein
VNSATSPSPHETPKAVEIVSGGKRIALEQVVFIDVGKGRWRMEFSVATQPDTVSLIEIVRGAGLGSSLMLSIDGGPVIGAETLTRPRYQTILSQPVRYEFAWP